MIPFDPDRIRVQARRYTVVKRWDDADTCYENLTSTFSPRNPHYFREWGDMLCSMGDFVSAKRKYEYAISIDPKSAIGFQSLGDLYVNKTDSMADAVRCFEESLSLGGQLNQSQIAVLCDAYFSSKRYRSFLNTSEMLLAYGPVDFPFHLRRSEAYYYLKEFDLALGEAVRSMSVADFGQIESASDLIQRIEDQIRKMTVDH